MKGQLPVYYLLVTNTLNCHDLTYYNSVRDQNHIYLINSRHVTHAVGIHPLITFQLSIMLV